MKRETVTKRLNLSVNVLPEKYKQRVLTFKQLVVMLATLCAIAIVVLFYQIVLGSLDTTNDLQLDAEYLNYRYNLNRVEQKKGREMQNTIAEYTEITDIQALVLTDIKTVKDTAATSSVQLAGIWHHGDEIEMNCDISIYGGSTPVATASLDIFVVALEAYDRFESATYPILIYPLQDYIVIDIAFPEQK